MPGEHDPDHSQRLRVLRARPQPALTMALTKKQILATVVTILVALGAAVKWAAADWAQGLLANIHAVPTLRSEVSVISAEQRKLEESVRRIDQNVQFLVEHELQRARDEAAAKGRRR